jgi:hypothetical protein
VEADTDGDGVYDWDSGELNWSKLDAIDPENWMGNLGDHIKSLKIKNVVLPGTHDSHTDGYEWVGVAYWVGPIPIPCQTVTDMLRCQDHSPRKQLLGGIRYFDLRYQWQDDDNKLTARNLRIWHGSCHTKDATIQQTIEEMVKPFVESHPKEIVILDLSHWSFMNEARHRAAAEYIVQQLGDFLVPWDISPNPINFGSPDVTVQELWEAEKNVIAIYHPDPKFMKPNTYDIHNDPDFAYGRLFWGGEFTAESTIVSAWADTTSHDVLYNKMKAALNCRSKINDDLQCEPPDAYDKLFVLQAQRTPTTPSNLATWASHTNPLVIEWLQEWTTIGDDLIPNISPQVARENLNIVIIDFYHYEGTDIHNSCRNKSFVETIAELNLNRAPLFK